jgi:hypothetical protein
MTEARTPDNYPLESLDPRRQENYLDVMLRLGVPWIDARQAYAGKRAVTPQHVVFQPPGKVQRLPDLKWCLCPLEIRRDVEMSSAELSGSALVVLRKPPLRGSGQFHSNYNRLRRRPRLTNRDVKMSF